MVGVTHPDAAPQANARLAQFLLEGQHGDMDWMARTAARRGDPRALWREVRSIIMLGLNYADGEDPLAILERRTRGAISVYARGDDYHDVIKPRLKALAGWLAGAAGGDVKVFVDTAAVMEKPLAQAAGIGWQGKHTNLVSRRLGSWLFLGARPDWCACPASRCRPPPQAAFPSRPRCRRRPSRHRRPHPRASARGP